jgi:hypothetical protein
MAIHSHVCAIVARCGDYVNIIQAHYVSMWQNGARGVLHLCYTNKPNHEVGGIPLERRAN